MAQLQPQFNFGVRGQRVAARQLQRGLAGSRFGQPLGAQQPDQLIQLGARQLGQRRLFAADGGFFRVALGADRHVLTRRHRQGARNQAGHPGGQQGRKRGAGARHAQHQSGGGNNAVVGAQHACAQPVQAVGRHRPLGLQVDGGWRS